MSALFTTLPAGLSEDRFGSLSCPHSAACCDACAAAHPEVVTAESGRFWIPDEADRAEVRRRLAVVAARRAELARPIPPPLRRFRSPGGRTFSVRDGLRDERVSADERRDPLWSEAFPVFHQGKRAGTLWRSMSYSREGEPARWQGTLSQIRPLYGLPLGIGYDVAAFDTAREAAAAWAASADQILDHVAKKIPQTEVSFARLAQKKARRA